MDFSLGGTAEVEIQHGIRGQRVVYRHPLPLVAEHVQGVTTVLDIGCPGDILPAIGRGRGLVEIDGAGWWCLGHRDLEGLAVAALAVGSGNFHRVGADLGGCGRPRHQAASAHIHTRRAADQVELYGCGAGGLDGVIGVIAVGNVDVGAGAPAGKNGRRNVVTDVAGNNQAEGLGATGQAAVMGHGNGVGTRTAGGNHHLFHGVAIVVAARGGTGRTRGIQHPGQVYRGSGIGYP